MVKSTKNRQIWFAIAKLVLFLAVCFLFVYQLDKAKFDLSTLQVVHWGSIIGVIALMPVNWLMEYLKWKQVLTVSEANYRKEAILPSFAAGILTGMVTPNMQGNFLGRMFYFQRRDRIQITILTLYSNYAQFIVSVFFGYIALFFLNDSPLGSPTDKMIWLGSLLITISLISYFYFDKILQLFFPSRVRLHLRMKAQGRKTRFKFSVLFLSVLRLLVFSFQFTLVLKAFGAVLEWEIILWIWQYYFWVSLAPSLFLGKFLVRDSIALWVLGYAGLASESILPSSLSIWVINLLVPTLISFILARNKIH